MTISGNFLPLTRKEQKSVRSRGYVIDSVRQPVYTLPTCVTTMATPPKFTSYHEFFAFYLEQHSNAGNRRLHAIGTLLGLLVAICALVTHHPWYALLWIPLGYGFAWTGHFLLEKNTPATFGHPLWSFVSDFRMLWLMLTGRLKQENDSQI